MQTIAHRDGDNWVITGEKHYTTIGTGGTRSHPGYDSMLAARGEGLPAGPAGPAAQPRRCDITVVRCTTM